MTTNKKVFLPVTTETFYYITSYSSMTQGLFTVSSSLKDFMDNPDLYGLVLFCGGEDVDPTLYGDVGGNKTGRANAYRDRLETKIFKHAVDHGIPMFGICRGLQFLNVMNGGRLIHDVKGHAGIHNMYSYKHITAPITVNSLHHQVCIPSSNSFVVGWEKTNNNIISGNYDKVIHWGGCLVEALIFPSTFSGGVQYHPEMMSQQSDAFIFARNLLIDIVSKNNDSLVSNWTYRNKYHKQNYVSGII